MIMKCLKISSRQNLTVGVWCFRSGSGILSTDTLLPYVVQWESEDSYKLTGPKLRETGAYIHGNVEALLRADPGTRADFYVKLIEHSVMCPDDARAKEEYNPIPGGLGKQFLVTKNLGSLESVLKGENGNA